jgi:DNA invertase Pin-like site-specific DNA recombinase
MRRAFSYARFSTPEQKEGRSLRRQREAAEAYCQRHGLQLDERSFADLGVSARHGANATHGQLAEFLELIDDGRIPKGSTLIVENIDRISRLPPDEATALVSRIVNAGVDVVTISPEQRYTKSNIHSVGVWVPLQVAICLAAEESRKKGERVADAWDDKRKTAGAVKVSKRGPCWLKLTADRKAWVVVEEKAALVRKLFALAVDGYGVGRIAGVMNQECPGGLCGNGWQPAAIALVLRSRAAIGEYQQHTGTCARKGRPSTRKPAGEPVKGYFPAVIDEATFYRAQAALDGRRRGGGRITGVPNLFGGVLFDALDGRRMVLNQQHGRGVLVSSGAIRRVKGSAYRSFRNDIFERALLGKLRELTPADVLGTPGAAEDKVATVSGKLTAVNHKLAAAQKRAAEEEDITELLDLVTDLGRQRKQLAAELEKAKGEAASQQGDDLGRLQSLAELLDACEPSERDALRQKVRAALRRTVRGVYVVVVARGRARLAGVQLWFADGQRRRNYLILHRVRANAAPGGGEEWWAESFAKAGLSETLDLRRRDHAARMEKDLVALEL